MDRLYSPGVWEDVRGKFDESLSTNKTKAEAAPSCALAVPKEAKTVLSTPEPTFCIFYKGTNVLRREHCCE